MRQHGDSTEQRVDDTSETGGDETGRLLVASGQGDGDAFRKLYELTVDDVHRYVASKVAYGQVDDLVAETYLRAFRSASSFVDRGTPALAWLITIARNLVASHYRRSAATPVPQADARTQASPEERAVESTERSAIVADLEQLPERFQQVLRLRFIDDLPVSVCANEMRMTEGAVRALTFRALSALRKQVE